MKKAIALLLAASMTLSLAACGGGGGGSSTPDSSSGDSEVVELTYWYSWTDKIQENNINLVNQFNETVGKEKGIHVTAEYQGTYVDQMCIRDRVHSSLKVISIMGSRTFAFS